MTMRIITGLRNDGGEFGVKYC